MEHFQSTLIIRDLHNYKGVPHEFFTNELIRADHEVHDIADGRYDGRIQ